MKNRSYHIIFQGKTHKEKESIIDCQDSYYAEKNCVAIADGASQSFYPKIWADLLVQHFCHHPEINEENWQEWLFPIQNKWLEIVKERVKTAKENSSPVWINNLNRLNFRESAISTFVGLHFIQDRKRVKLCIIGDSCLFHLKISSEKKADLNSYLLKNSQEFSDAPEYFASYSKDNKFNPIFTEIAIDDDHYFLLATDALSEYIFKCLENNENIFRKLIEIKSQEEFEQFIFDARKKENKIRMKNDDITLVTIKSGINIKEDKNHVKKDNLSSEEYSNEYLTTLPKEKITKHRYGRNSSFNQIAKNIKYIFRVLFIFPRVAINHISSIFFNNTEKDRKSRNNDIQKQNRYLKKQRIIFFTLILILFSLLLFSNFRNQDGGNLVLGKGKIFFVEKRESIFLEKEENVFLSKGKTKIYGDQEFNKLLIDYLDNSWVIPVETQDEEWIKFKTDLYTKADNINSCNSNDICNIKKNSNLLQDSTPTGNNKLRFAELKASSEFKQYRSNIPRPDDQNLWKKIEFEGYIKKDKR